MDASTMQRIEERNGFVIKKDENDRFPYYIFHANKGTYEDAYKTLEEAREYCDEEI